MKHIASRDNPFVKTLRQWSGDAAARRSAGVALLEGIHLADAFLRSGGVPRTVVVGRSALDDAEVVALLERTSTAEPYVLEDAVFASLSQLAHGVPLLLVIEPARPDPPPRIVSTSVVLDRIQDPGNVGSILRSAAAAGIADVWLSGECAGAWSPKVLRAAMGGHFHLRLFEDCEPAALMRDAAIPWIATSPHAGASLYDTDLTGDVVWVFGHEGQGLAPELMRDARAVRIPQPGHGESLNVAASAAICFFEQARQRRLRGAP